MIVGGLVYDPFIQGDTQGEPGVSERKRIVQVLTEASGGGGRMDAPPAAV